MHAYTSHTHTPTHHTLSVSLFHPHPHPPIEWQAHKIFRRWYPHIHKYNPQTHLHPHIYTPTHTHSHTYTPTHKHPMTIHAYAEDTDTHTHTHVLNSIPHNYWCWVFVRPWWHSRVDCLPVWPAYAVFSGLVECSLVSSEWMPEEGPVGRKSFLATGTVKHSMQNSVCVCMCVCECVCVVRMC